MLPSPLKVNSTAFYTIMAAPDQRDALPARVIGTFAAPSPRPGRRETHPLPRNLINTWLQPGEPAPQKVANCFNSFLLPAVIVPLRGAPPAIPPALPHRGHRRPGPNPRRSSLFKPLQGVFYRRPFDGTTVRVKSCLIVLFFPNRHQPICAPGIPRRAKKWQRRPAAAPLTPARNFMATPS